MATARAFHSATLLPHECVLIAGGFGNNEPLGSAELYNAEANRFLPLPDMSAARARHAAVSLPGGLVLIVGGAGGRTQPGISSTEIFDIENKRFLQGGSMVKPRCDLPEPVVLTNALVLVVGGAPIDEVYDPATKSFSATGGKAENTRWFQSATLLSDGKVLIAGGADEKGRSTAQAWLYTP
jgi:hypothetical protein